MTPIQCSKSYDGPFLKGVLERDEEFMSEWVLHKMEEFG